MSNASRLLQLQERLGSRQSRLQITEIVEADPVPEYDKIGLELKAHRTRKGHEIEMAGRVLRIKIKHLEAIEESRYDALPGRTYAIGFVRAYAEHLGLDPDECIRRFKLEYAAALEPASTDGAPSAKPQLSFPELRDEVRLPHGSIIILAGILVLGVWGGWYLTNSAERAFSETETVSLPPVDVPTPEDAEAILRAAQGGGAQDSVAQIASPVGEPAGTEGEAAAVQTPLEEGTDTEIGEEAVRPPSTHAEQLVAALTGTGQDAPAVEEQAAALEINTSPEPQPAAVSRTHEAQIFGMQNHNARVILRARGTTWVRVEGPSGAVLFEETLQRGDSYRVPNIPGLILATRNAGAVELLLDGASLGPAGAVGQALVETSLDAETLLAR